MLNSVRLEVVGFFDCLRNSVEEIASRDEDSRGARTLTDDSKEEREAFITDRSVSESAKEKKRVIIEAEEH